MYHLILAPTHACNLRCAHCYLPDHAGHLLPEGVAMRLLDEWSEITVEDHGRFGGIFHVKGGEPFVVPYLGRLMIRLAELQTLHLMMTTNGTFTSDHHLTALERCSDALSGRATVIVSLDGASAATHDALRGAGQFDITRSFIDSLRQRKIRTFLNCVLHSGNLHEVDKYLDMALEASVAQVNFLPIVPRGYGASLRFRQEPHLRVQDAVHRAYESRDDQTRALLAGSLSHILRLATQGRAAPAHECVAGYRGLFYITPDGHAFTCPNLINSRFSVGNVVEEPLRAIMARLPHSGRNWHLREGIPRIDSSAPRNGSCMDPLGITPIWHDYESFKGPSPSNHPMGRRPRIA